MTASAFSLHEDIYVEGSLLSALRAALTYGMTFGPDLLGILDGALDIPNERIPGHGKRVWWRRKFSPFDANQGVERYWYVSLDPGGFTTEHPDPKTALVREFPTNGEKTFTSILSSLAENAEKKQTAFRDAIAARNLSRSEFPSAYTDIKKRFNSIYGLSVANARARLKDEISDLYEQGLIAFGMPLMDFSSSMALLQIYVCCGIKAENETFSSPAASVQAVLQHIKNESDARRLSHYLEFIQKMYEDAKHYRQKAFAAGSLIEFYRHLYLSLHAFFSTTILSNNVNLRKLGLSFSGHVAEEQFANIISSSVVLQRFFAKHPFSIPDTWSRLLENNTVQEEKEVLKREWSSPANPIFPTYLFELFFLFAYQRFRSKEGTLDDQTRGEILTQFLEIEKQTPLSLDRDRQGWIDFIILNAAKELGNEQTASQRARAIAARVIVAKAVGLSDLGR